MSQNNNSSVFKTILHSIDLFGVKPRLNFNNRDKFNTKTGGAISILFFMVLIMGCIYFSQELFNKQKPSVLQADIYDSYPRQFNITPDRFSLFYGLQDTDFNYYIDPTIYQLEVTLQTIYRTMDENNQPVFNYAYKLLRTEQCDLQRHFSYFVKDFEGQALAGLSCIHPDDAKALFIEGTWGEESYVYLSAKFAVCKNGTDIICKSQEVIDSYLNGAYVAVDFIDTIFDPANYTTPHKYIRKDFFTTVSNLYYKEWAFYMNNVDYYTDGGILIESENYKQHLSFETSVEMLDMRKQDIFSHVLFRLSNMKLSVHRKYIKFQDVLAQMGGLMNGLRVIMKAILSSYFLNNYFSSMINKLLIIPDETKAKFQYEKNISISPLQPKSTADKIVIAPINPSPTVNGLKQIQQKPSQNIFQLKSTIHEEHLKYLDRNKRKLRLSTYDNLRLVFCGIFNRKKAKLILFEKGKFRIESNTNIVNINKKFEEYDIITNILFDKNATCILAYLMQNKVLKVDGVNRDEYAVKLDDVIKAYHNLENNHINENLRKTLEDVISSFLNNNLGLR
jgi:hypothetical protein